MDQETVALVAILGFFGGLFGLLAFFAYLKSVPAPTPVASLNSGTLSREDLRQIRYEVKQARTS
jgi:hypothetical protein